MKPPHGIKEVREVYGDVVLGKIDGKVDIIAPHGWESANCLVIRDLPKFGPRPLYIHKKIEAPLRAALAAALLRCPDYAIRTMGCFCPRAKRTGSGDPSLHSWAVAVDINASTNPMGDKLVSDMPPDFIACFTEQGWTWGGKFSRPDAMHFQYASGY